MKFVRNAWALALVVSSLFSSGDCAAQSAPRSFPTKPVKLLVGNEPGGGSDITGRLLALKLSALWGQPVVVENRAGAGGYIAMNLLSQAPPDGYTLMVMSNSSLSSVAVTNPEFDVQKSLAPVSTVNSQPFVLVVNQSLPANTLPELIALAKSKPGILNYGSPGTGSLPHMGTELLKTMTGINVVHVPYKGAGPAMAALMADQIQMYFGSTLAVSPHMAPKGKLKAIAVAGPERMKTEPSWPTMAEAGQPNFELPLWYGLFATGGTPASVVQAINRDVALVLKDADTMARFARDGSVPWTGRPEDLRDVMLKEHGNWSKLAKDLKITP